MWNSSGKASTSQETSASAGGEKVKTRAEKQYVIVPHPSNTSNNIISVNPAWVTYQRHSFTFAKRFRLPVSVGSPWEANGVPSPLYGFGLKARSPSPVGPISRSLRSARPPFLRNGKSG